MSQSTLKSLWNQGAKNHKQRLNIYQTRNYTGRSQQTSKISFPSEKQAQFGQYERIYPAPIYTRKPIPKAPTIEYVGCTIKRPSYVPLGIPPDWPLEIPKLSGLSLEKMKKACRLAAETLKYSGTLVKPGVSTLFLDQQIHKYITDRNAYPSPLNYMGYPKSVCTSINNIVAHGIPDSRPLSEGDIINIDITLYIGGYHGDTSATFMVGEVDEKGRNLLHHTKHALMDAIKLCGPGVKYSSIGNLIEPYAIDNGYSTNQIFSGHGIGTNFHQNPLIYHFKNDEPGVMQVGSVFTIEPMLNQGTKQVIFYPDGWTASTKDGGRSAQYEHTILITDNGAEILTL